MRQIHLEYRLLQEHPYTDDGLKPYPLWKESVWRLLVVQPTMEQGDFIMLKVFDKVEILPSIYDCNFTCFNGCDWHAWGKNDDQTSSIQAVIWDQANPDDVYTEIHCAHGCDSRQEMMVQGKNFLNEHYFFLVEQGTGEMLGWYKEDEIKLTGG